MQKLALRLLLLLMVFVSGNVFAYAVQVTPRKGVIRVKLQPEVAAQVGNSPRMKTAGVLSTGITPLDASSKAIKAYSIRRMIPYSPKDEARLAEFGLNRWYDITFDESVTTEQAISVFKRTAGVQYAHGIIPMELKEDAKFRKVKAAPKAASSTMPFNDPYLPSQWHYNNDGSISQSKAGADINLFKAWETTTGSKDVIVAVIDGGIDLTHEDLAANIAVNTAELNGTTGVDDDNNGYVDDIYGWNFCTNTGEIYPHDHGTHVAGTVAAVNNNGKGVAGVAGGNGNTDSGVKMISVQVFDSRSGTQDADFAAAIVYAARRGASIAQCSWGWASADYVEQSVLDAIDYFTKYAGGDNMTGGLCIFAAGNSGSTGNWYPGCYEPVVCVAAMNDDLTPSSYSNYGEWVDVVAPGGIMDFGDIHGILSTLPNNQYGYSEGTSMATPHVSGIAALFLSKYGKPEFVNETLRQQLVTSVNDFYTANPQVEGLFGSGYIDAAKVLVMGDGSAPEAVAAINAYPGQDNVSLEWVVPASSDNNVFNHILYYSTTEFDASSDLSAIDRVSIDTKFLSSGETATYELTGLQPLTTYYMALKAVNRWGEASALSPVISATTNAGPKMAIDKTSLSFTIDASISDTGNAIFNISNQDEGLLKWQGKIGTTSYTPATRSLGSIRPTIGNVVSSKSKIGITPYASKASELVTADYEKDDYPQSFKYYKEYWASIGESDKSLPNSEAQWFTVDAATYPNGFNLTNVEINSTYGQNPTIQIYDGSKAISSATLLAEVTPSYFYNGYQVPLSEQIFFAPGTSFWVVVHFPAESNQENYPLGLATAEETYGSYSYMSNDMGKTWMLLSEALKGSPYETMGNGVSWAITAISKNPAWDKVFTLSPSEGQVKYGESQEVSMLNDGQKLVNGTYKFNVSFTTNESETNTTKIPVTVTVKGNVPQLVPVKVINFGSLLVGESKSIDVELYNEGYGVFTGKYGALQKSDCTISSEHYSVDNIPSSGIAARSAAKLTVKYTPQSAGSHTGTVTIKNANGIEFKITVQGVATDPAKIVIEPDTLDLGDVDVEAEAVTSEFTIKNEGNYPLEYVFPKFSDQKLEVSNGKASHKYGYTALTNLKGATDFAYDGNPELIGGIDITSTFTDDVKVTNAIPLGFDFPFYGKTYDKVYINSLGAIAFSVGEYSYFPPLSESSESIKGVGYISAYGHQLQFGPNSKVVYAKQDGKFVVKFENVLAVKYDVETTPISFRIMLSANGDVEIFYDDYIRTEMGYDDWTGEFEIDRLFQGGSTLFCAIKDPEGNDPLVITSADIADYWGNYPDDAAAHLYEHFTTGSSVKIEAPAAYFITAIEPAYGLVNPGESVTVNATVKANDTMYAGATTNRLTIETNDPNAATAYVNFNANITGASLTADAVLESDVIDFGQVFRTSVSQLPVTVKNAGKSVLEVSSVVIASGLFKTDVTTPFTIEPGMAKDIVVTLPTETEGSVTDKMTITATTGEMQVTLVGEVIGCPAATLSFSEITETVESGAELTKELTVSNSGDENLVFSVLPGAFTNIIDNNPGDADVSYAYKTAVDDENIAYEWVDIETTGLGEQYNFSYYNQNDYTTVELPFEFPFYGKKYTEMYIYNTGFVSFTKRDDQNMWPEPPAVFPGGSIYTNIIAPYWGLHTMDVSKTAGTYHYVTEDQAVVSWMEYGNTMNMGVCYQLIMKKDGSFKFQYKGYGEYPVIYDAFGLAGVANEDGSQSLVIPDRLIQFNNAVQFYPVVETTIAPSESKSLNVVVDTDKMAGAYTDVITVNTNIPAKEKIEIPVNLTVTGVAVPVFPTDTIVEEHVAGYVDYNDPFGPANGVGSYDILIDIANTGKASFSVDYMEIVSDATYLDPYYGDELPAFQYLGYYGMHYDSWFGTSYEGWGLYQGSPIVVDNKGLKLAIPVAYDVANKIGEYKGEVVLMVSGLEDVSEIRIPFKVIVTDIPYAYINKEMEPVTEIRIENAAPDHKSVETVTLSNMGAYKLKYELKLDPTGVGEEADNLGGGGIAPMSHTVDVLADTAVKVLSSNLKTEITPLANKTENVLDAPSADAFEYNNALYHPSLTGRGSLSYGSGTTYGQYIAATYYEVPEEGFNISHVYFASTLSNLDDKGNIESVLSNVDYTIEIVAGDDYENGTVLGKGTFHVDEMDGAQFIIAPLDKAVYLEGGQGFYIRITYPIGVKYPAYMTYKEDSVVSNRYMGYVDGYGWFDVASMFKDTYGSLGYIMTALETVPGEPWVKVLNETSTGEIAVEESVDINIAINAAAAPLEKGNKAMLVIKSNDPQQPIINFPIYLDLNGAPTITAPTESVYAKEGAETNVTINVTDAEGDDLTLMFSDPSQLATVKSVKSVDTTAEVVTAEDGTISVKNAPSGAVVEVSVTPSYEDAGKYAFTLTASDVYESKAQAIVNYEVQDVNRAPEAIVMEDLQIALDAVSPVIALENLFSDPDGDEMTYELILSKEGIVSSFVNATNVIFIGTNVGEVTVKVVATDANGASTSTEFKVIVTEPSGIDENSLNAKVEVYPNPVVETLYVTCDFSDKNAVYAIYAANGSLVYSSKGAAVQGESKSINVANLAEGVYVLKVTTENGSATFHVVKK
ncbi:MAG: S8 family serine peptidase [Muribaculaceae bacterium]|nr:S8 family serine peptidase [Muribaculaceae bacterium]